VGRPIHRQWVSVELTRSCRRAGVARLTPHQYLRHGGATLLLALGVDLVTIRDVPGHYSIDMTEVYAHMLDDAMGDAADRMDAAFRGDE
jgi:site-specific recombinase XerD